MTIFSVLLSALIPFSYSITICEEEPCSFEIQPGGEYGCGCNIKNCNLDVSNTDGKGITLYTYASVTSAICREKDSCQGATILYGIEPELGKGLLKTNCVGNILKKEININCKESTSCKDMNITSIGGKVNVKAFKIDAFDEGILDCYGAGNECLLECDNKIESCTDAKCNQQCNCIGKKCPGFTDAPTRNPVVELPDPTDPPVIEIPEVPTYVTCEGLTDNGKCTLTPSENDIIVIKRSDNIKILEISCTERQQCKGIKLYSAANTTEIICNGDYQTCIDSQIYIGHLDIDEIPYGAKRNDFPNTVYNTVLMSCDGEDTCKQTNITIRGKFASNPVIMSMGSSSFETSKLLCDLFGVSCKLMCNNKKPQACLNSECIGTCIAADLYPEHVVEVVPPVVDVVPENPVNNNVDVVTPNNNPPNNNIAKRVIHHNRVPEVLVLTEVVLGTKNGKVTLDNTKSECKIDCSGKDQCMGITVYSGCNSTEIVCGEAACKNAKFYIGALTDELPAGSTSANFAGDKHSVIVRCDDYQACNKATIKFVGKFTQLASISSMMPNGLYKATLISLTQDVLINCDNTDGCKDLLVACSDINECSCNGGSCTLLDKRSNNAITITPSPTLPSVSPTSKPSIAPSSKPTLSPTSSDLVIYTPIARGLYICKNNIDTCILDCNNEFSQCDQGVILLSGANNTNVLCDNADTCKEIKLYFGTAVTHGVLNQNNINHVTVSDFVNSNAISINVNCSAPSACKKSLIKAVVSLSTGFKLETAGNGDALKDTELDITVAEGQTCSIDCDIIGCKDAIFTNIATCTCSGTSCPAPLRKSINYVPSHGVNMNVNGSSHYPTFLPTAIIVCISIGLICLVSFCIYYKYFTTEEKKLQEQYNDNTLLNNDGNYDTFNKQTALEMNQI